MTKIISSIVGNGIQGYEGNNIIATNCKLDNPFHVEIDHQNKYLYIADCFNFKIRKLDLKTNIISDFAGTGIQGHSGDNGPALEANIDEIYALQIDEDGNVYICQRFNPCIRKIEATSGNIVTIAGTGIQGSGKDHIPATESQFIEPNDCILDGSGNLLVADVQDQKIRSINLTTGIITTFAGTGIKEHSGDGKLAINAGIFGARAICVDVSGNTYVCEREGNTIRKINKNNIISTVAGTGKKGYTGDGDLAINCTFNGPKAIRCDQYGNVLIVDTENHCIRIFDITTNNISTIAGGIKGRHGDESNPLDAGLDRPHGIVTNKMNHIFIADSENHKIRIVK